MKDKIFTAVIPPTMTPFQQLSFGVSALQGLPSDSPIIPDILHGLEGDASTCLHLLKAYRPQLDDLTFIYFRSMVGTALNVITRSWSRYTGWRRYHPISLELPPLP